MIKIKSKLLREYKDTGFNKYDIKDELNKLLEDYGSPNKKNNIQIINK